MVGYHSRQWQWGHINQTHALAHSAAAPSNPSHVPKRQLSTPSCGSWEASFGYLPPETEKGKTRWSGHVAESAFQDFSGTPSIFATWALCSHVIPWSRELKTLMGFSGPDITFKPAHTGSLTQFNVSHNYFLQNKGGKATEFYIMSSLS